MSYSELKNHKLASYIVCVVIGIVFFLGLMFVIICLTSQNYLTKKSYTEIITEQQKNIVYNFEKQKFKLNNIAVQLINNKIISDVIFTYGEKDIYTYKEASVHTEQYLTYNGIEKAVFYNENIGKVFVSSSMIPIDFDEYVSYTPHIKYAINEYKNGNRIVNENAINIDESNFYTKNHKNCITYTVNDQNGVYIVFYVTDDTVLSDINANSNELFKTCIYGEHFGYLGYNEIFDNEMVEDFYNSQKKLNVVSAKGKLYVCMSTDSYVVITVAYNDSLKIFNRKLILPTTLFFIVVLLCSIMYVVIIYFRSLFVVQKYTDSITRSIRENNVTFKELKSIFLNRNVLDDDKKAIKRMISYKCRCFAVMTMHIDDFSLFAEKKIKDDVEKTMMSLMIEIKKELCKEFKVFVEFIENDCIGIFLMSNENVIYNEILDKIEYIRKEIISKYNLTATFTLSNIMFNADEAISRCNAINELKNYRYLCGHNSIITEDVENYINRDREYPLEIQKNITRSINLRNVEEYYKYLDEFILLANETSCYDAKEWLVRLAFAMVTETAVIYKEHINYRLLHDMWETETIEQAIEILQGIVPAKNYNKLSFKENVDEIISVEYNNVDFNLHLLADKLNLTAPYVGQKFKKEYGKTFNNYILEYRIKMAVLMLTETDDTVAIVAKRCGFENAGYFAKVFKKQMSITPSEYKFIHMNNID